MFFPVDSAEEIIDGGDVIRKYGYQMTLTDEKLATMKTELLGLLKERSVLLGEITLASGEKSDFYVDSKLTTLHPRGAHLVGRLGWALITRYAAQHKVVINAVGGLTFGADPIALSTGLASMKDDDQKSLEVFSVRKSPKEHGRCRLIEGNLHEGDVAVVVDDVITTGGSTLKAIRAVTEAGAKVAFVIALVDRNEGGKENIEQEGYSVFSILTRDELEGNSSGSDQEINS